MGSYSKWYYPISQYASLVRIRIQKALLLLFLKKNSFFTLLVINFSIPDAPFSTFALITPLMDPMQLEEPPLRTIPLRTKKKNTQVPRLGDTTSAASPNEQVSTILADDGPPTTSPPPPTDETPLEVPARQTFPHRAHKIVTQSPRLAETSSAAPFKIWT